MTAASTLASLIICFPIPSSKASFAISIDPSISSWVTAAQGKLQETGAKISLKQNSGLLTSTKANLFKPFRDIQISSQSPESNIAVDHLKVFISVCLLPPEQIRELVPESQAYMDLLAFERKLDQTIMRKRVDIQEALKRPMKQKRKLRLYISNTFNPARPDADDSDGSIASWELRVEGKLLDDVSFPGKQKKKFSSFFKSLVIELDKDLYGPDNHLVEWHRTATTQETDGFQVKRPGDVSVRCTLLLMLDYQPPQFKLDPRLARLLGIHTQTRSCIIQALWQYVKTNKLQDSHDKEYINCDKYFQQIFDCPRLKFSEIPQRLTNLLLPPDPIVINHVISVDPNDQKKTACYDIDVEVEDPLKSQMSSFLLSTANQQEIASLDNKIHETIESINQLKIQRDFMLSFSRDPKGYIQDWLKSQSRDLKLMTDVVGNPEEERRAAFYHEPWSQEAVSRYFYCKIQQRRQELEQALAVRNT
uniref:SWI/SNF related BAF chromatin remodeling complex subunit D3 n=1 Tax=Scophthalmus maximus TaxID=52904 RepID=A0A8D3BMX8_SCOMX